MTRPAARLGGLLAAWVVASGAAVADDAAVAKRVLELAGLRRGLCVHLGCGRTTSPSLTAELATGSEMLVHGLALDEVSLDRARKAVEAKGLLGRAKVEKVDVTPLPYLPNLANLVVIEDPAALKDRGLSDEEVLRIVAPGGVVCRLTGGRWTRVVKPRPAEMDDWTHPAHGPDGNRVSGDKLVRFPVGLRWQAGVPMNFNLWAACRAWVVAEGRCFTVSTSEQENLAPASFLKHKQEEYLTARDAYNGLPLWKVNCETTNDGKALNNRNTAPLVTDGRRVYAYKKDALVAFDAATGEVVRTYPVKHPTVRLVLDGGVLVASGWEAREAKGLWDPWTSKTDAGSVEAFDAETGKARWSLPRPAQRIVAADGNIYLLLQSAAPAKEQEIVCLDRQSGQERWRVAHSRFSEQADLDVTTAGLGIVSVARTKSKAVAILAADSGKLLWEIKPTGGFWTPLVDGRLWHGNKQYDPGTGEVKGTLTSGVGSPGCTPAAVVGNYVTASRGCSYIDLAPPDSSPAAPKAAQIRYGGARGGCLQGAVPANGMFYTSQNFCRCAPGQVQGFVAFGPSGAVPAAADFETARPIEKGPAFGSVQGAGPSAGQWPMFLGGPERSGFVAGSLPARLKVAWQAQAARPADGPLAAAWKARLNSCLTAPVAAGGLVLAAGVDEGRLVALDAQTGKCAWTFTAGGRIDTPPTLHRGLCLFGSHDGWVYALRAADGRLAWRTRAAPWERRMVAFGQVESVWPAIGSVVVHDNVLYVTAGRTTESDGGLAVLALEPMTGQYVWGKEVAPGPVRVNDLLALRDGKLALHHIRLDPKSGDGKLDAKGDGKGSLEGLVDGSWTRIGTRRSGNHSFGKAVGELIVFNGEKVFGYQSRSRACFAMDRKTAEAPGKPSAKDNLWQVSLPANHQAEAMALCDSAVVLAGRVCDGKSDKVAGFLSLLSPGDGKTLLELPLDCPPVYHGLVVADGRLYVSLEDGKIICLTQAD